MLASAWQVKNKLGDALDLAGRTLQSSLRSSAPLARSDPVMANVPTKHVAYLALEPPAAIGEVAVLGGEETTADKEQQVTCEKSA